jgi:hypothetical protein
MGIGDKNQPIKPSIGISEYPKEEYHWIENDGVKQGTSAILVQFQTI